MRVFTGTQGLRQWVLLLAIAEAIGMTAAASAARASQTLVAEARGAGPVSLVILLATAGGIIEGLAVAIATAIALRAMAPGLPARRWILVTTAAAAAGWAGGSLPGSLAPATSAESGQPPVLLVMAGAAGIGVLMGAALGVVQALMLRGHVPHPWRWVGASTLAWPPAMAIIFLGATTPDTSWSTLRVISLGTLTGSLAGCFLGAVLGWSAPSLQGASVAGRLLLGLMTSPVRGLLPAGLIGLSVRGRVSGVWHDLPVVAAPDTAGLVVVPGNAEKKRWWRNLRTPSRVRVVRDGRWSDGEGWLVPASDPSYCDTAAAYRRRYPRAHLARDPVLIRIVLDEPAPSVGPLSRPMPTQRL